MSLDRIVQVNISRLTTAVTQKGFGTALILGDVSEKPGTQTTRTRTYFDLDGVLGDYASTTEVYKAAQAYFGQDISPEQVVVGFIEGSETVAEALNAIKDENSTWYAVGLIDDTQATQEALAAYIETDSRIAGVRTNAAVAIDVAETGILGHLKTNAYDRTFGIYSSNADTQYPEFAWFGRVLPRDPGSITWKFKTLAGITADKLTAAAIANLLAKNGNFYHEFGGVNITEEGTMGSGAFIDEIRGTDFIQARMQENVFAKLVNVDKIPFTNGGIDLVVNLMYEVLNQSVAQNILSSDPYPTITAPDVREIPFNDRATRTLTNIKFSGVLAGAVHKVEIDGTLTI